MKKMGKKAAILLVVIVLMVFGPLAAGYTDPAVPKFEEPEFSVTGAVKAGGVSLAEKVVKQKTGFRLSDVSKFKKKAYVKVHDNKPYFKDYMLKAKSFEKYSPLDDLGRCGTAAACIDQDIMPGGKPRGSISEVKPTGWHTYRYKGISGGYLYNRCHLIGYQLTAENANKRNLITGTRYLNVDGMLPFENMVADYIRETGNHVLYRVTPEFSGDDLEARGVLMEARSVEDDGEGIEYCVYCYNNQPGVKINYKTGTSTGTGKNSGSKAASSASKKKSRSKKAASEQKSASAGSSDTADTSDTYICSINSKVFHKPGCSGAARISEKNKVTGTRQQMIDSGRRPCKICNP